MMRKYYIILLILLCLFANNSIAKECENVCTNIEQIEPFDWTDVINAIAKVESNGNEKAVSKNGKHCGILQITATLVKECNKIANYKKFTLNDRFNKEKSIEMFCLFQKRYNPTNNIEKAIRMWNGGTNYSKAKTQRYYKEVMKHYNKTVGI